MPIDKKDLYQHAFDSLRHASDFRLKILGGWALTYSALGGIFAWSREHAAITIGPLLLIAMVLTALFWRAEIRNRPAIKQAKLSGLHIERTANSIEIPHDCRFFVGLEKKPDVFKCGGHGFLVDIFAGMSLVLLIAGLVLYLDWRFLNWIVPKIIQWH